MRAYIDLPTMSLRQQLTSRGITQIPTSGGLRAQTRLLNNKRMLRLYVTIRAEVQVTTLATNVRNKGSAAALVSLFVNENGADRLTVDGRVAAFLTGAYAAGAPTNVRQTAVAVGTYQLVERICLHFSPRQAVVPSETTFAENSPTAPLFLEAIAHPSGFARLFTGGVGTINSLSMEVETEFVDESAAKDLPYFITTMREQIENVSGVNAAFPIFLRTPHRLRGIVISQDSDAGEVSDIITSLVLRGDNRDIIGPVPVSYENLVQQQENEFAGTVYLPSDATRKCSHLFLNFQQEGRLTRVLNPSRDYTNLRLELGTQTSAAANPRVRITYIELERPPVTDGRVLVNPFMPTELAV